MAIKQRWKDKLRPASFRGVRFLVDQVAIETGRRGPDFEFPDRDVPYAEDTGRKQRKYDIEGYLVGPDYFAAKNKLLQACEKKGSGALVHPYYGRLQVVCRSVKVQETAGAGGFVKFSFSFVEAGQLSFPKVDADRAFLVDLAGKLLGQSAADALTSVFNTADQAQFVLDSATNKLLDVAGRLDSLSAAITGAADPLAEFAFAVRQLKASAADLAASPAALVQNIQDAFDLLFEVASPDQSFTGFRKFFTFGADDPTIPDTTAMRAQQLTNGAALNNFVQTAAVTRAANAAMSMQFLTLEDALAARNAIADQLDALMERTNDDSFFGSLQSMRAEVVQAIPGQQDLAQVATLVLPETTPSLIVAYELYGNVDLEQDIIDRNRIQRPGFVQGGQELKVLDRG